MDGREKGAGNPYTGQAGIRDQGSGNSHNPHPGTPQKRGYRPSPSREGLKYGQVSVAYKMTRRWDRENIETSALISRAENSSRSGIMF